MADSPINIDDFDFENFKFATREEIEAMGDPIVDDDIKKSNSKKESKITNSDKLVYNALELYKLKILSVPKLLNPFLQKVGLASLVGTSDSGKSTFLRQLAICIVLDTKKFMGFDLIGKYNKVIYVSTEDDASSISYSIRKQVDFLKLDNEIENLDGLENLEFIFDTDELYENLSKKLTKTPVDLIIIDAFADVFTKEINANTQVRSFLNKYDQLAKKHKCLILFLHHTAKRTSNIAPTKDSIIGSQGFEAKMRVVLEIRPNFKNDKQKDLWVLKSNFLESNHKSHSYTLDFNENLIFSNTGYRASKQVKAKSNDTELINEILKLHNQGLSSRKIEEELKNSIFQVSKSVVAQIIKKNI